MTSYDELFAIADTLKKSSERINADEIAERLSPLDEAANTVGRAFSGSWQGYHSRVYYAGIVPPPPGAHFSQEWGLMDTFGPLGSCGDWREYDAEDIKAHTWHRGQTYTFYKAIGGTGNALIFQCDFVKCVGLTPCPCYNAIKK